MWGEMISPTPLGPFAVVFVTSAEAHLRRWDDACAFDMQLTLLSRYPVFRSGRSVVDSNHPRCGTTAAPKVMGGARGGATPRILLLFLVLTALPICG
jgi:hypothetical protein